VQRLRAATEQLTRQSEALATRQKELQRERERWRKLFHLAPDSMVVTNEMGAVLEANSQARRLLRIDNLQRRPVLLGLRFAPSVRTDFLKMLRNPASHVNQPIIVRLAETEHSQFRGELRCVPVDDKEILWLLRDVSKTERTRQALEHAIQREREAVAELKAIDEMRKAFILGLSHDLRSPVAAIAGLASVLRSQELPADEHARVVVRLEESARDLATTLRDLFDYERVTALATPVPLQRVDVADAIRHAAELVDTSDHDLQLDLLPTHAHVNNAVVERITVNLVRNAVKHTPPGTSIWVRCRRERDGVLLVVEDNGPGIPANRRQAVFEVFQPAGLRESGGGLGVGLALVRRFAQLHGGYARVEERKGGGASFHVFLAEAESSSGRIRNGHATPDTDVAAVFGSTTSSTSPRRPR